MLRLTEDQRHYVDPDGVVYNRVSDLTKMAEYFDDGLVYAGSAMAAKRAKELVDCAVRGELFSRPTVVNGEPATVETNLETWDCEPWIRSHVASEMQKARNRGHVIDALAIHFANCGALSVVDSGHWAREFAIDAGMSFDESSLVNRASVLAAWWARFNPKPIAWQVQVSDPETCIAGTLDMLAEIEGARYLIDWKAGSYRAAYKCQIATYRVMPVVWHEDPATAEAIRAFKSECTPALVCLGEDRAQFRPVTDCIKWAGALTTQLGLFRALREKEDSPVMKELSHTMTVFEKAEVA